MHMFATQATGVDRDDPLASPLRTVTDWPREARTEAAADPERDVPSRAARAITEDTSRVQTHVFGGTVAPRWSMQWLYGPLARRVAQGGPVAFHTMAPVGGLGRTDRLVDRFRPILEAAAGEGRQVRLAGHSLGGAVAWVLAHEYPDAVELVELWGAPVRGTAVARLFTMVAPEARYLLPHSRWLARYDRPLNGPIVRAVYSGCDGIVVPPRHSSAIEGDRAENHFVTAPICPFSTTRRSGRADEIVHRGVVDHVLLPRHSATGRALESQAAA